MPVKHVRRRRTKSLKRGRTPMSPTRPGRSKSAVTRSSQTRRRKSSPRKKPQKKYRELNTAQNARSYSVFRRLGKTPQSTSFRSPKLPMLERLEEIVAKLGLIPGERAMEFALAYDSIGPLLKMRESLEVLPPFAPPGSDKFNLMYVPEVFSPAMRKMRSINKFAEDILLGYRRNTASGCELDVRAAVKEQIEKLNEVPESLGNREEIKKRKSRGHSIARKRLSSVKRREPDAPFKENLLDAGASASSQRSVSLGMGSRRPRKACSVCAQRIATNMATGPGSERHPALKRHRGANKGNMVACRVLGARYFTEPNNLPIFYKHIKLNNWL